MVAAFRVFARHVLQPGQSQIWRGLVALGYSNWKRNCFQSTFLSQAGREFGLLVQYLPREVSVTEHNLLRQVFEWYENVFEYA